MKKVIYTEKAPAAIGPYSQAIEINDIVFLSGQLPVNPSTGELVENNVAQQTAQCFENIKSILNSFKFLDEINELNKKDILFNVVDNFYRKKDVFDPHNSDDLAMGNMFEALTSPGATLTVALYVYAKEQGEFEVAFAIAAILMILTLIINFSATLVQKYFEKRRKV